MESWNRKNRKKLQVDIDANGIEKALMKGKEDYDKRRFHLEVCVFTHIIAGIISGPHEEIPMGQVSKKWLFEVLDTRVYQALFKKSLRQCDTNETPSEYMINLYQEFKEWQAKGGARQKHATTKVFDGRYELGEFKKEPWMKNIDT